MLAAPPFLSLSAPRRASQVQVSPWGTRNCLHSGLSWPMLGSEGPNAGLGESPSSSKTPLDGALRASHSPTGTKGPGRRVIVTSRPDHSSHSAPTCCSLTCCAVGSRARDFSAVFCGRMEGDRRTEGGEQGRRGRVSPRPWTRPGSRGHLQLRGTSAPSPHGSPGSLCPHLSDRGCPLSPAARGP